jgi:hypothetical protein
MGLDELSRNGITQKIVYFLLDHTMMPYNVPLWHMCKSCILLFVAVQLIMFRVTFVITQMISVFPSRFLAC